METEIAQSPAIGTEPRADKDNTDNDDDTFKSFLMLLAIFSAAFLAMAFLYAYSPQLSASDAATVKLPRNLDDLKALGRVISRYNGDFYAQVVVAYVTTYIFLQSFAIPGSIFLSILAGFMFPFPLALFLVCFCSATGATFCYLLSSIVGRKIVQRYFPERIASWRKQISAHSSDMLSYMTFLRITPLLPNWFINITAPVLNVPLTPFFVGTFLGVAPPSFGFISAGVELYELTTTGDAFSFHAIVLVVISAAISLLPVVFRRTLRKKME